MKRRRIFAPRRRGRAFAWLGWMLSWIRLPICTATMTVAPASAHAFAADFGSSATSQLLPLLLLIAVVGLALATLPMVTSFRRVIRRVLFATLVPVGFLASGR